MTSELRRLQQELQEAVRTSGSTQQVTDEARMIANDKQVEASASWAAMLLFVILSVHRSASILRQMIEVSLSMPPGSEDLYPRRVSSTQIDL